MSLKELAAHLGLSQTTVSRVVNQSPGSRRISPETQQRVLAAADELNYTPNALARGLRNKHSQTVSVIVPEISDGYSTTVLSGIEDALLIAGYFYFVVSHRHRPELLRKYPRLLLSRAVEGIIAVDTPLEEDLPIPVVSVSGHLRHKSVVNIELDHTLAAHYALEHLRSLGHREIAIIKGQRFSSDTQSRWQAIQRVARKLGITLHPKLVVELEGTGIGSEPGRAATVKLLGRQVQFTAIFAFNDVSAIGAIQALRDANLSVPRQVSVVGFDDIASAATNAPALTTVRQPLQEMGRVAAMTLLQLLQGESAGTLQNPIRVLPSFVQRNSTASVLQTARAQEPILFHETRG
ncbi:LacI family DNA-binding transcriptional regulator [Edaphobacter bradus]|uniref:LacI family DNA-binding transcriptional regulator n=1 Tax=Edaphobacter bradus TaxID=2259016 RepID=UPI0021DFAD0A|nr:LacI family DNA-binding transcriptional regulator [Edaphobacter bradus]